MMVWVLAVGNEAVNAAARLTNATVWMVPPMSTSKVTEPVGVPL